MWASIILLLMILVFARFFYWAAHTHKMPSYDRQYTRDQRRRVTVIRVKHLPSK